MTRVIVRVALRLAALLATGAPAVGQSPPPPPPGPPAAPAKALSKSELLKALPDEDRAWLTEFVAPIIMPQEEKIFLELDEPHQRERFRREFWVRREREGLPPPLGPGYRVRY